MNEGRVRDFKFIVESEKHLTEWMVNNLLISFIPYSHGKRLLKELEKEVIYILNPILNLTGNPLNENGSMIKELRSKCRDIARIKQNELKRL